VELLLLARLGWRSLLVRVESLVFGLTVLAYVVGAALIIGTISSSRSATLGSYWAYDTVNFPVILETTSTSRNLLYTAR
jgi:hypothetical protein